MSVRNQFKAAYFGHPAVYGSQSAVMLNGSSSNNKRRRYQPGASRCPLP